VTAMSWEQLRSIVQADKQERAYWDSLPPRACPNDGTPLETGPDGSLFCRMGDYTYPQDGKW
jgi:hypothetical protein